MPPSRHPSPLRNVLDLLDGFLLAASPLAIIMFVFGAIVFIDALITHQNMVANFVSNGKSAQATVSLVYPGDKEVVVDYLDSEGKEQFGILKTQYYPQIIQQAWVEGASLRILYAQNSDSKVLAADYLDNVHSYAGHLLEPSILLLISWLVIIFHPEFLYIGYPKPAKEASS